MMDNEFLMTFYAVLLLNIVRRKYDLTIVFVIYLSTECTFVFVKALRYVRQIAQETSGEVVYGLGRQPAVLRTFSQRLSRYLHTLS